jgi:hypothetical protein
VIPKDACVSHAKDGDRTIESIVVTQKGMVKEVTVGGETKKLLKAKAAQDKNKGKAGPEVGI